MVVEIRHEHSKRRVHIMRKFQREMTMAITRGYAAMLSMLSYDDGAIFRIWVTVVLVLGIGGEEIYSSDTRY
jgi:hypothetical protein